MAEYGYRHAVPGLGVFNSRLTLEELRTQDSTRATEVGPILDANRHSYGRFLDTWPVGEDPFTYEARVHLFARDRNLAKAREQGFAGLAAEQLTTAWYENRLVETFFGNTLEQSSYRWDPTAPKADRGLRTTRIPIFTAPSDPTSSPSHPRGPSAPPFCCWLRL